MRSRFLPLMPMLGLTVASLFNAPYSAAALPRYDHIVIVIEENRSATQIIGDRLNAPYINSLADGGVRFGSTFGLVHPSQPNYIHLFFDP